MRTSSPHNQFVFVDESAGFHEYHVDGSTYSPHGSVTSADGQDESVDLRSEPVQRLAEICALCNDAKITYTVSGSCAILVSHDESIFRREAVMVLWANQQRQL
jgi:hypothetical protein